MPIKYECPKCNRRFVDWGAEKLGFKCPDCEEQDLLRVGAPAATESPAPSLRRQNKKTSEKPAPSPVETDDSLDDDDDAFLDDDDDSSDDDSFDDDGDENPKPRSTKKKSGGDDGDDGDDDSDDDSDDDDLPEDLDFDDSHGMDGGLEDFEEE